MTASPSVRSSTSSSPRHTRLAIDGAALVAVAVAAKVLLVGCLLHALAFPNLPQYQDKAMGYRLVAYPVLVALVPLVVWNRHRRGAAHRSRRSWYPWLVDLCATLPFLFDSLGNAANLYDTVTWWDDAMHVATWAPLVVAFGLVARRRVIDPLVLAGLCVGFGAVTHIGWEVGEYLTFVQTNPGESVSAYRDTVGDLTMSLLGSLLGGSVVGLVARAARARGIEGVGPTDAVGATPAVSAAATAASSLTAAGAIS